LKKLHPQSAQVALLEGDLAMSLQDPAAAAAAFANAYKLEPSGAAAIRNYHARTVARLPTPTALLEQWLQHQPEDPVAGMVLAEALMVDGRRDRAIAQYERLAAGPRPNAMVLNNLGWLYHESGDSRAEATARRAYDVAPRSAAVADTYGWILVQKGKVAEGLAILEPAARTTGAEAEIRYHYAVALARTGQRDKAREQLRNLTSGNERFGSAEEARRLLADLGG
jgi:Tfp pilus assembly protein PilF